MVATFLSLLALPTTGHSQTFRAFDALSGGPNGHITGFAQDSDGFLFIGSASGLYVSSGGDFTRITAGDENPFTDVTAVAAAEGGTLLVATTHGLFLRDHARIHRIALPLDRKTEITAFGQDYILLGGDDSPDGQSLWKIHPRSGSPAVERLVSAQEASDSAGQMPLHNIMVANGTVWLGCRHEICRLRDGTFSRMGPSSGVPSDDWVAFGAEQEGGIFARSRTRLLHIDSAGAVTEEQIPTPPPPVYDDGARSLFLFVMGNGSVVTPGGYSLVVRSQDGIWGEMPPPNGHKLGIVDSAFLDREGGLWLDILHQGVTRVAGFPFWHSYGADEGLPAEAASALRRDGMGAFWLAFSGGLFKYGSKNGHLDGTSPPVHLDLRVRSLVRTGDGAIWASGTDPVLIRADPRTYAVQKIAAPVGLTSAMALDTAGRLWIGTQSGLVRIDDPLHPPSHLPPPMALAGQKVNAITFDQYGSVLVLTDNALFRQAPAENTFTPVVDIAELGIGAGRLMLVTMNNDIWLAGEHGGLRQVSLNDGNAASISGISGLPAVFDTITALYRDSRGWLWIGTHKGVQVQTTSGWRHFDIETGMISNNIRRGGIGEDDDGTLWFATDRGFSMLRNPARLPPLPTLHTHILSASLGSVDLFGPKHPWSEQNRQLKVDFVAPSFVGESLLSYQYRVDQIESSARETRGQFALYPHIPGSQFSFAVQGQDDFNGRTVLPASLSGHQDELVPATSRMLWWLVGSAVVVPSLIGIGIWRALLMRQHNIEKRVRDRTRVMEEVQEQLIRQSRVDSLTGLLNRRAVLEELEYLVRNQLENEILSVALIDIDHFKSVNDSYGHQGGDLVLAEYGKRLHEECHSGFIVGRYGGEELILVFSGNISSSHVWDKINMTHQALGKPIVVDGKDVVVTCSIGVAMLSAGDNAVRLIGRADRALYKAKRSGRDRVVMAE